MSAHASTYSLLASRAPGAGQVQRTAIGSGAEVSRIGSELRMKQANDGTGDALADATSGAGEILVVGIEPTHGVPHKLRAAGYTVSFSTTAERAREFVSERMPVAILLGPGTGPDPYEVVRWLRAQERLAFVQIFIFAARRPGFRVGDALSAGADDVFDLLDESHAGAEETATRILSRVVRAAVMTELALLDPLTGLHNRRFLNDRLPAEIARATRAGDKLAIALLDLDHFKTINDTLGHAVGDRVLTSFAQALKTDLRAYDILCRWGGDEFIVIFPDCGIEDALCALRHLQARRSWTLAKDAPQVTFSAGVAECRNAGDDWQTVFDAADRNLRSAKRHGRDLSV